MANVPVIEKGGTISQIVPQVDLSPVLKSGSAKGAQAFDLIGGLLNRASGMVEDRLDIQAAEEGRRAGIVAGQEGVPDVQDNATIRGRAFNESARASVSVAQDLAGRSRLAELEQEHGDDPAAFSKAAKSYAEGVRVKLAQQHPDLAADFIGNFELRRQGVTNRIVQKQQAIHRDRQLENALRLQMNLNDELADMSQQLFTTSPEEVAGILARMGSGASKLIDLSSQIGPDGTPLFSARERVAFERSARTQVSENIGMAYLQNQADPIQGLEMLRSGKAEFEIVGEDGDPQRINVSETIGFDASQSVRKKFIQKLSGEISLENKIAAQRDRAFKQQSDELFGALSVLVQDGQLEPSIVEAARSSLEPDQYVSLRAAAKSSGASISDGNVLTRLSVLDAEGQDVRDELVADYQRGKLKSDDFLSLYRRNTERLGKGAKLPIQTGKDYLTKSLGALSKEIGLGQSAAIGQAEAEYDVQIEKFVVENGRQPSHVEARDLAEDVRARYTVLSAADGLLSLPLPSTMTQAEKLSRDLTAKDIGEKVRSLNKITLEKYNGDVDARNADPSYRREIKLLEQYYNLLVTKEKDNGRTVPRR